MPRKPGKKNSAAISAIIGIGIDNTDGHQRVTGTEEMMIVGGSSETHERMQETAIRFAETLQSRGQRLQDNTVSESLHMLREAIEKTC